MLLRTQVQAELERIVGPGQALAEGTSVLNRESYERLPSHSPWRGSTASPLANGHQRRARLWSCAASAVRASFIAVQERLSPCDWADHEGAHLPAERSLGA
jgi:hypothetical protein